MNTCSIRDHLELLIFSLVPTFTITQFINTTSMLILGPVMIAIICSFILFHILCKKINKLAISRIVKTYYLMMFGGSVYAQIEIIYRGYTDISMFFVGGICFILIGLINEIVDVSITTQMIISAIFIVVIEFISGYFLNIVLGLNIWDYSSLPYNFHGQICLLFFNLWILLSFVGIIFDDVLRNILFNENYPQYRL